VADLLAAREVQVEKLVSSADAYEDLLIKAAKGLEFYFKLDTNVAKLLDKTKGVVKVQQEDRDARVAARMPANFPPTIPLAPGLGMSLGGMGLYSSTMGASAPVPDPARPEVIPLAEEPTPQPTVTTALPAELPKPPRLTLREVLEQRKDLQSMTQGGKKAEEPASPSASITSSSADETASSGKPMPMPQHVMPYTPSTPDQIPLRATPSAVASPPSPTAETNAEATSADQDVDQAAQKSVFSTPEASSSAVPVNAPPVAPEPSTMPAPVASTPPVGQGFSTMPTSTASTPQMFPNQQALTTIMTSVTTTSTSADALYTAPTAATIAPAGYASVTPTHPALSPAQPLLGPATYSSEQFYSLQKPAEVPTSAVPASISQPMTPATQMASVNGHAGYVTATKDAADAMAAMQIVMQLPQAQTAPISGQVGSQPRPVTPGSPAHYAPRPALATSTPSQPQWPPAQATPSVVPAVSAYGQAGQIRPPSVASMIPMVYPSQQQHPQPQQPVQVMPQSHQLMVQPAMPNQAPVQRHQQQQPLSLQQPLVPQQQMQRPVAPQHQMQQHQVQRPLVQQPQVQPQQPLTQHLQQPQLQRPQLQPTTVYQPQIQRPQMSQVQHGQLQEHLTPQHHGQQPTVQQPMVPQPVVQRSLLPQPTLQQPAAVQLPPTQQAPIHQGQQSQWQQQSAQQFALTGQTPQGQFQQRPPLHPQHQPYPGQQPQRQQQQQSFQPQTQFTPQIRPQGEPVVARPPMSQALPYPTQNQPPKTGPTITSTPPTARPVTSHYAPSTGSVPASLPPTVGPTPAPYPPTTGIPHLTRPAGMAPYPVSTSANPYPPTTGLAEKPHQPAYTPTIGPAAGTPGYPPVPASGGAPFRPYYPANNGYGQQRFPQPLPYPAAASAAPYGGQQRPLVSQPGTTANVGGQQQQAPPAFPPQPTVDQLLQ